MDVAYSEQAAVLLKGSFLSESRKLKDGNALTVSTGGIFLVRIYQSWLVKVVQGNGSVFGGILGCVVLLSLQYWARIDIM